MSNIKYNETKINEFKKAFLEYHTAIASFKKEINQFKSTMDFMERNQTRIWHPQLVYPSMY